MRRDDAGYVTVEHAVGFAAVTLVIGVLAATAQAGLTGSSLCQAVREGARAASIGEANAQDAATASYPGGSYTVERGNGRVTVTGSAPYRGAAGWIGGQAHCTVTTIDEGDLPWPAHSIRHPTASATKDPGQSTASDSSLWRLPSLFSSRESVPRAPLPCGCKPSQT